MEDIKWSMSQQCALVTNRVKWILSCIRKSMDSRSRGVILSIYSVLVKQHLECCVWIWAPQDRDKRADPVESDKYD